MNTPNFYERRDDRTVAEQQASEPSTGEDTPRLAVHRDPSLTGQPTGQQPARSTPTVTWVRPSELPTLIGGARVRRGIDLQSDLVRRSRRAPAKAASRAGRRITRTAIARPEPPTPREGLEL